MTIDIDSLTINDLTPEIMAQMSPSDIAKFKARLTPEQMQTLADKMGGSQIVPPEMSPEEIAALQGNGEKNIQNNAATVSAQPINPTVQKGSVIFGRK